MRICLVIIGVLVVFGSSCRETGEGVKVGGGAESEVEVVERVEVPLFDEVWMMDGWQGYMCVVIGVKGGAYWYWFMSDVPERRDVHVPYEGRVRKSSEGIFLRASDEDFLYASEWRFVEKGGERMLAAVDDLEKGRDDGRWLREVDPELFAKYYAEGGPFIIHGNRQLEE